MPRYRQLYWALRRAIADGVLAPGQVLPSTRQLSQTIGVSRTMVVEAYNQLIAEGYIEGRQGSGTYVASGLVLPEPGKLTSAYSDSWSTAHSSKPFLKAGTNRPRMIRPFAPDIPDIYSFPMTIWTRLTSKTLKNMPARLLDYPDPQGYRPLREAIADHLLSTRGARISPDRILITHGTRHSLNLLLPILARPGQTIWVEDPGYRGILDAANLAQLKIAGIAVGVHGLQWPNLSSSSSSPAAAYVTPSHQYPLGVTMSAPHRQALVQWAQENKVWILEDDYDSEYRYRGYPLGSLHSIDTQERVIYLGTFSKVLAPMLRIGYAVLPQTLIGPAVELRKTWDHGQSVMEQIVLAQFLIEGHYARHLRRMRSIYHARQETLLKAASRWWGDAIQMTSSDTGLHLIAWLPADINDSAIASKLQDLGIEASPLSQHRVTHPINPGLILGYAAYHTEDIEKAVRQAAPVLSNMKR